MDAIILAGGLGTRLRSTVPDVPKPLAPVAGRPFIEWVLRPLTASPAVDRVILSVGYRGDMIRSAVGSSFGGKPVLYVDEETPLGTGGALRRALAGVQGDNALLLNGDTFAEFDPVALFERHVGAVRPVTLCLVEVRDTGRYGRVTIDGHSVSAFGAKGGDGKGLINAGVYALRTDLFGEFDADDPFSFESDFIEPFVGALRPAFLRLTGQFIDIGIPDDYARAQHLFAEHGG